MRRTCLKIRFMANVMILILVFPALASAEMEFNQIISFGASLSDPGNAFVLTGEQTTPPYDTLDPLLIPSAAYAKGGHHFSNGGTWIEQLAKNARLAGDANSAFLEAGTNYAVGGARALYVAGKFNLSQQVNMFLADFGQAPSDALYTLEFGGNDIRDVLNGDDPINLYYAAVAISSNIETLYEYGARKFLVWNAPDLGLTPALKIASMYNPNAAALATGASATFNFYLGLELDSLRADYGDEIQIALFDSFAIMHELVGQPDLYGLANTEYACVQPGVPPFQCKKPDEYLFWDGIHPTKAAHAILAEKAADALLMEP